MVAVIGGLTNVPSTGSSSGHESESSSQWDRLRLERRAGVGSWRAPTVTRLNGDAGADSVGADGVGADGVGADGAGADGGDGSVVVAVAPGAGGDVDLDADAGGAGDGGEGFLVEVLAAANIALRGLASASARARTARMLD